MALEILANTSLMSQHLPSDVVMQCSPITAWDKPKGYKCMQNGCCREFSTKRNLLDHCRGHHEGRKPHVCGLCGKGFLRPAHLLIHTRIHTGEKPFMCSFEGCGKRWNQKSALKQHMRSHTGEKPFVCSVPGCDKRFSTSSSCKRHTLTHGKVSVTMGIIVSKKRERSVDEMDEVPAKPSKRMAIEDPMNSSSSDEETALSMCKMTVSFILN